MHTRTSSQHPKNLWALGMLFLLILLSFSFAAKADQAAIQCTVVLADSPVQDAAVQMHKFQDVAARICRAPTGAIVKYYSLSEAWRDRFSVCQFWETDRSDSKSKDGKLIGISMLFSQSKTCPKQDDPDYIETHGVSTGVFVALLNYWKKIVSSRANFDGVLFNLSAEDRDLISTDKTIDAFFSKRARLELRQIAFTPEFRNFTSATGYELRGPTIDSRTVAIYVDLTSKGFEIFSVEEIER